MHPVLQRSLSASAPRLAYVAAQPPGAHGELEAGEHRPGSPKTKTVMKRPARWCSGPSAHANAMASWGAAPAAGIPRFHLLLRGLQKLTNPNFFNAQSPSSIPGQLIAANRISPLARALGHLLQFRHALGIVIALGELAVGIGALLGLWTASPLWVHGASAMLFSPSASTPPLLHGRDIVSSSPDPVAHRRCRVLSLDSLISSFARNEVGRARRSSCPSPSSSCRRCAATSTMATVPHKRARRATPRAAPTSPPSTLRASGPTPTPSTAGCSCSAARAVATAALSDSPPRASRGDRPDGGRRQVGRNRARARCPGPPLRDRPRRPLHGRHDHRAGGVTTTTTPVAVPAGTRVGAGQDVPVGGSPPSSCPRAATRD